MRTNINYLTSLMFRTGRIIREGTMPRQRINPFSALHLLTLNYINEHQNPTMADIAKFLSVTPPSATSLIGSLARLGYIVRNHDRSDRRLVRLSVTAKGHQAMANGYKQFTRQMKTILRHLDEVDRNHFVRILNKLANIYNR